MKASGVDVSAVVTFGSPLVGDASLGELLAGIPVRRYVDCCDLIARVPPARLDRDHVRQLLADLTSHRWPPGSFEARVVPRLAKQVSKLFSRSSGEPDYVPVGSLCYTNRHGQTSQSVRDEERLLDQDAARREYPHVKGDDAVRVRDLADHAPINYVSALAGRTPLDRAVTAKLPSSMPAARLYTTKEVLAAEQFYVDQRRAAHGQPPLAENPQLRGLCLSGGGIRSATFCLGVLQALAKRGELARFDYLSTVSGGGYIGTCLTSLLTRTRGAMAREPWRAETKVGLDAESFPLTGLGAGEPERVAEETRLNVRNQMHHLRTHSEYLMSHRGLLSRDVLRAVGQVGGGLVYTLTMYLLLLGLAVASLHLLVSTFDPELRLLQPPAEVTVENADKLGAAAYVKAFVGGWWRDRIAAPLASVFAPEAPIWKLAALGLGFVWSLSWLYWSRWKTEWLAVDAAVDFRKQRAGWSADDEREARVVRLFNVASVVAMLPFSVLALVKTKFGTLAVWYPALVLPIAFAIGGLAAVLLSVAFTETFSQHDDSLRDRRRRSVRGAMLGSAWLGLVVAALVPVFLVALAALANLPGKLFQAVVMLVAGYLLARKPTAKAGLFGALRIGARPVLTAVTVAFLLITAAWMSETLLTVYDRVPVIPGIAVVGAFVVLAAMLVVLGYTVDANRVSPHYFYRDRLSEAYLQTLAPVDRGDDGKAQGRPVLLLRNDEDLLLRDAGGVEDDDGRRRQFGPYHLLVTALNLRGSDELNRRSFLSDHFIFSPGFVGSSITGFARTDQYEGGQLRLARPMAISAAAVGSGVGFQTFWAQAFFATLFNARLGYWMQNPWWQANHDSIGKHARNLTFWPAYLLRELMGMSDARRRLINLSDGGHTGDNLGLLPLLERRCDYIVVADAEADAKHGFGSFMNAVRLAEVELDVDIDIDVGPIQRRTKQDEGYELSGAAVATGTIHYPARTDAKGAPLPAKTGTLVYLKAAAAKCACGGDEGPTLPVHVVAYLRENVQFPHQGTIDQFFDDAQFESYRGLGFHVAEGAVLELAKKAAAAAKSAAGDGAGAAGAGSLGPQAPAAKPQAQPAMTKAPTPTPA